MSRPSRPPAMRFTGFAHAVLCLGLAAAGLPLLILPALAGQADAASAAGTTAPRPAITVTTVARETIASLLPVSGSIVARDEVLVMPQVDGLALIEVVAEAGDTVRPGQVLARLDRAPLEAQRAQNAAQVDRVTAAIGQAQAQIAEAEANLAQARSALERTEALRLGRSTTADILDQRVAAAASAEARLASSRQALASAEAERAVILAQGREIALRLARTEIVAPRGGVISRRTAPLGAIAGMAVSEPLFRIIADGAVELDAEVPEKDMPRLKTGLAVRVWPAGREPTMGTIRLVRPEIDRLTRLGKVRVELPALDAGALGSFARGEIEVARREGLVIPASALHYTASGTTVQVVKEGVVATRAVKIGLTGNGRIDIVEGLDAGEQVVRRAGTFLRDGDLVNPVFLPLASN